MARKSRATGVGRGNGAGSAKGQFRAGRPSGNPRGRTPKPKEEPPASFQDALSRVLLRDVEVTEDGRRKKLPQFQAMIEYAVASFPKMPASIQIRFLHFCLEHAPSVKEGRPPEIPGEALGNLVDWLASQAPDLGPDC